MDSKDAWNDFMQSGSVLDYLRYKAMESMFETADEGFAPEDDKIDEVQDQGTDTPTAEYR